MSPRSDRSPNLFPLLNAVWVSAACVVLIVVMLAHGQPFIALGAAVFAIAFWVFVLVAVRRDSFRPK